MCEYWPVRIVARDGQQTEVVTNAFVNVIPCFASRFSTFVICETASQRWSSLRMTTMLGRLGAAGRAGRAEAPPDAARTAKTAAAGAPKRRSDVSTLRAISPRTMPEAAVFRTTCPRAAAQRSSEITRAARSAPPGSTGR